jgi:hypothetical protein
MSQNTNKSPKPVQRNNMLNYFAKKTPNTAEKSEKIEEKESPKLSSKKLDFGKILRTFN